MKFLLLLFLLGPEFLFASPVINCEDIKFYKANNENLNSLTVDFNSKIQHHVNEFLKRQLNYDNEILSEMNNILNKAKYVDADGSFKLKLGVLNEMRSFLEINYPDLLKTRKIHGNNRLHRRITDLSDFLLKNVKRSEASPLGSQSVYLDVGAGNGAIASGLAKINGITPDRVYALEIAEYANRAQDVNWITYNDEGRIPLEDNSVDDITLMMVLHHAPFPKHLISEIYRVSKPAGQLVVRETDASDQETLGLNAAEVVALNQILDNMLYVVFDPNSGVPMMNNYQPAQYWLGLFKNAGFKGEVFETLEPGSPFQPVYFHLKKN